MKNLLIFILKLVATYLFSLIYFLQMVIALIMWDKRFLDLDFHDGMGILWFEKKSD